LSLTAVGQLGGVGGAGLIVIDEFQ
jgi:hypothetical protein